MPSVTHQKVREKKKMNINSTKIILEVIQYQISHNSIAFKGSLHLSSSVELEKLS